MTHTIYNFFLSFFIQPDRLYILIYIVHSCYVSLHVQLEQLILFSHFIFETEKQENWPFFFDRTTESNES